MVFAIITIFTIISTTAIMKILRVKFPIVRMVSDSDFRFRNPFTRRVATVSKRTQLFVTDIIYKCCIISSTDDIHFI